MRRIRECADLIEMKVEKARLRSGPAGLFCHLLSLLTVHCTIDDDLRVLNLLSMVLHRHIDYRDASIVRSIVTPLLQTDGTPCL